MHALYKQQQHEMTDCFYSLYDLSKLVVHMSIVPYNSNTEIVYHDPNHGIIVVHNNQLQTIQLLSTHKLDQGVKEDIVKEINDHFTAPLNTGSGSGGHRCPNCGFSWNQSKRKSNDFGNLLDIANMDKFEFNKLFNSLPQGFMRHEYFKLLERLPDRSPSAPAQSSSSIDAPHFNVAQDIFNQGYFKKFFKKVPPYELGSGAHAYVYKVVHVLNDINLGTYAVKRISVGDKFELLDQVLNEVLILYELSVKGANENNLIRYNHVWLELGDINDLSTYIVGDNDTNSNPQIPYVFILQQYCDGGHLEDLIVKNFQREKTLSAKEKVDLERLRRKARKAHISLPETTEKKWLNEVEIWKFFKDVATGVNYLHLHGILHRDLKPSNCLLESKYENKEMEMRLFSNSYEFEEQLDKLPKVLLSDFGEGLFIDKYSIPEPNEYINNKYTSDYERGGNTGTLEFTAPELWLYSDPLGTETKSFINSFTYESDIYSLGLILCYLCVGQLPFSLQIGSISDPQVIRKSIISWYATLTPQTFHAWFSPLIEEKGICKGCKQDFEHLTYSMLKGDCSGNGQLINRATSSDILRSLETIKLTRFFAADAIISLSRRNSSVGPMNEDEPDFPLQADTDPVTPNRSLALVKHMSRTLNSYTMHLYIVNLLAQEIVGYFTHKRLVFAKVLTLAAILVEVSQLIPQPYKIPLAVAIFSISFTAVATGY